MCLNVLFLLVSTSEDIQECPFEKGTSNEDVIIWILEREMNSVIANEQLSRENVESLGRSNQSIIYHHTIQTQTCC